MAEAGVYTMMGLDKKPDSFDFDFDFQSRVYEISLMGARRQFYGTFKIADFYADKKLVRIKLSGRDFTLHPLIDLGFILKSGVNLDKKSTKMYN
ncbi:MAG: hypothetical protein NUV45_02300 [Tepidanaerobacteraceae bacterium]|nr:hypothetical protein [Tepidanaerobacteraceae bacterium]